MTTRPAVMDKRLHSLQQESEKLNKDVAVLEDALILHQRFKEQNESSVRGMIRKEIGGAIWQHGGTGKLRTYRSAKDLNENADMSSTKRSQRRQKYQTSTVSKPPTNSIGKTQDNREIAGPLDYACKGSNTIILKDVNVGKEISDAETSKGLVEDTTNPLNFGKMNVNKVTEMKTKVLEKASINVIKRKKDVHRDNTEKQRGQIKGKRDKEKIVKSDRNVNNSAESNSHKENKTSTKMVEKVTVKEVLDREAHLLSDKSNRKEVKQTNRILVDFDTGKLDTNDFLRRETEPDRQVKMSEVPKAETLQRSPDYSSSRSNLVSGTDVVLQQKDLLRKSLNCDPDVHLWLRQLGLLEEEKYVQIFAQNEIDMEVLVTLDEKQLEKMGVVALGAMKKLVRGVEELRSSAKKGRKDGTGFIPPRKTEVRKSLHDAHTKSSELKRTISDENRNKDMRKSHSDMQIKPLNSDVGKSRNSTNIISDIDTEPMEKEFESSKRSSHHSMKTGSLVTNEDSGKKTDKIHVVEEKKKLISLSAKETNDSQRKVNTSKVGAKDDNYGKFARSTNSKKPEKTVTSLKRSNSFHSQSSTKSETDFIKSGQQAQKPSSTCSKEKTDKKRDDSLTRTLGTRARADSASSSVKSQGKGSNRPKSEHGINLPKGKAVLTQKKAEEGVKSAAGKFEERQKQEVEEEKRKVKNQERQKQYRDVMAARHQRRQTDRKKNENVGDIADVNSSSDNETDDNCSSHLTQLIGVKITRNDTSDKDDKPPIPSGDNREGRQMSRTHLSKPPNKQSLAVATNSVQLTPHFAGNPQNSSRSSVKSYARFSYSARKNTVKDIESQISSLQKRALAGEMVTMDLVKNLQRRLEEIESSIKQSDDTATKKQKSSHKKAPMIEEETSSEEEESDLLKPLKDLDFHKVLSKPSKVKGLSISMSKKELMKEIHKEKKAHRKEIRHLRAELNRSRYTDSGKTVEVDQHDIDFQESDLIGEGAFSKVYHGVYQGTDVAIKQLKVPLSSHDRNYFAAEVSLLRDLRHPRVVMLMGVVTTSRFPLMILEYMARGSLYHLLHDQSRDVLDHAEFYRYAHDVALGMNYLHQHKPAVLHLDLKSMNVLICSNDRAKIADFGFSKFRHDADMKAITSSKAKPVRACPAWTAPELLETGEINPKADVYSFAIILWEMLTRKQPYEGCSTFQVLERTRLNKRPEIPDNCPKELSNFIKQCWDPLPSRRPPFKDILHQLENMAFPPDWQALLKEAGVPPVALEDVQSTRTIISLVNNTLDTENVKTMVEEVRRSCDSHVTESFGLDYLYNQDHVEMYTPRSPARVGKGKSTMLMQNSLARDIIALESEEMFEEVDDSYLSFSAIRDNHRRNQEMSSSGQLLTSPHSITKKSLNLDDSGQISGKNKVNTKDMGTSTSIDMDSASDQDSIGQENKNDKHSEKDSVPPSPSNTSSDKYKFVHKGEDRCQSPSVIGPTLQLTKNMIESMAKDRRVTIASKSMDMKSIRESLLTQIKQSPKTLRSSLDASSRDKTPLSKSVPKSHKADVAKETPEVMQNTDGQDNDLQKRGTKIESRSSGQEEQGHSSQLDSRPKDKKGDVHREVSDSNSGPKGEKENIQVTESRSECQHGDKPVPTPRNICKTDTDDRERKKYRQEDLNAQIKRKLAERNKAKMKVKQECVSDENKHVKLESKNNVKADKQKQSSQSEESFVKDSLDLEGRDVCNTVKTEVKKTDVVKEEEDDVSEIENDSLENSPRDSLEDRNDILHENTKAQPFTVVTNSAPKFHESSANNEGKSKMADSKPISNGDKLNTSADSSLKTCRQSVEAWVEERPNKDFVGKQKTRKVTPPSPHSVPPPPILIPVNPPPAPPAPPAPPIPTQDSAFLVVKSAVKNPLRQNTEKVLPKDNSAKSETTTNSNVPYALQSVELRAQKEMLQSTSKPHPNQLHDLSVVSRGTMSSIAEILKRAVFDRRIAMGEDAFSPSASVTSSWSFMDE